MGNVATIINSINFNDQAAGVENRNKDRLLFAYKEYVKRDPDFFNKFKQQLEIEDSKIVKFLLAEELSPPDKELDLIGGDGLFNMITEEQALKLSQQIEELLPQFAKPTV